jgi:anti-sigma factor RsiW
MNCAQIKEQLVDFLYGELSANEQAAFSEHLRGCPGCHAEVTSHQNTLGRARAALSGPLAEEPPARIHAAALAAARAAAAPPARRPAIEEKPGFFAWLWRTPWLLPAFGAASVATAVFLVRVLKNPEVIPGQHPRSLDERSIGASTATPPPAPAQEPAALPAAPAAGLGPAEAKKAKTPGALGEVAKQASHEARRLVAGAAGKGAAPTVAEPARRKSGDLDHLIAGSKASGTAGGGTPSRFAEPPPPRPSSRTSAEEDDLLGGLTGEGKSASAAAQAGAKPAVNEAKLAKKAKLARDATGAEALADESEDRPAGRVGRQADQALLEKREYAAPPPAAAPAPVAAEPARPSPRAVSAANASAALGAPAAAPAKATAHADKARRAAPAAEAAPAKVADSMAVEPRSDTGESSKARAKDAAGPSLEESIRKAERLFANQDWSAAAAAYRDLLRRFPTHKDAAKWRARVDQSLVAEAEARQRKDAQTGSKAAKAKSNDVLMKEMK